MSSRSISLGLPCRYVFAILGSLGMGIAYALKVNLSVAIVSMVNHSARSYQEEVKDLNVTKFTAFDVESQALFVRALDDKTEQQDGPLIWSLSLQGTILSSIFWGYLVGQIPGGRLAEVFSAKWIFFIGISTNIIATLLTPIACYFHYSLLIVLRVLEGIGGAFTFPAMHVLIANWAPPNERNSISTIIYTGTLMGTVFSMLSAGVIAYRIGWEAVFYIMGSAACPWMVFWVFFVSDIPSENRFIKERELQYITHALSTSAKHIRPFPCKAVFKSIPFWALLITHMSVNWGWYMVLTQLPLYMKMIHKLNIEENALLTTLPFFLMGMFTITYGQLMDCLKSRKLLSNTFIRKMSSFIASIVPQLCLVQLCYTGENRTISIVLMTVAITFLGANQCGFLTNHIDLAPNYAGTLMAITNTFATIPGIVVPIFVGKLTHADPTISSWRTIFWVTACFYLIQMIVFTFLASGEEQKWNKVEDPEDVNTASRPEE